MMIAERCRATIIWKNQPQGRGTRARSRAGASYRWQAIVGLVGGGAGVCAAARKAGNAIASSATPRAQRFTI
jgi:hypothetical protein